MKKFCLFVFLLLTLTVKTQTCTLTASKNPACIGDTVWLFASNSFSANTFSWTGPNGFTGINDTVKIVLNTMSFSGNYQCSIGTSTVSSCFAVIDLTVNPIPMVNIVSSPNTGCAPLNMTFTCTSFPAPMSVNWQFGNSLSATGQTANTSFTSSGTYTTIANVTDFNSCKGTSSNTVEVYPKPNAQIIVSPTTGCIGSNFNFTGAGGSSYYWNFGGMIGTSNLSNPSVTFPSNGNYNIILITSNGYGCKDTAIKTITVLSQPSPTIFPGYNFDPCGKFICVSFTCAAATPLQNSFWSFGNGQTSTNLYNAVSCYSVNGFYIAKDSVIDINGCVGVDSKTLNIALINNIYNFTYTVGINGSVTFSAIWLPGLTWNWNFTAPNQSIIYNPTFIFPDTTQNYNVCLIIKDSNNCTDTICKTVFFNTAIGINEINNKDELKIYPNPVSDFLNIIGMQKNSELEIYDGLGNLILKQNNTPEKIKVNVKGLNSGIHFVRIIQNNKEILTRKIVKD